MIPAFLMLSTTACDGVTDVNAGGDIFIEALRFSRGTTQPGEPIGIVAHVPQRSSTGPSLHIETSSGGADTRRLAPWSELSTQELAALIQDANGRVFVGYKETNATSGVDGKGNNMTSDSTVQHMTALLLQHGAMIEWSYELIPAVVAHIPTDVAFLTMLRDHPNVEYVEPIFGGQWHAGGTPPAPTRSVLAIIRPGSGSLHAAAGDTITAWYRQPNGTLLRATAAVR
jgi:hypothetical protein